MITNLCLKEYLYFIEEKKLRIENFKDSLKESINIPPNKIYDLLVVIDEIILHSLNTIKQVICHNKIDLDGDKSISLSERISNKKEMCEESNYSPKNYRIGLRQQYKAFSKLKNSAEIIKIKKNTKNLLKNDEKHNDAPENTSKMKVIYVINYFKKMHLRNDFKAHFANKFGEGSYEKFKQNILKNEYSGEILDQIIIDIRKFHETANDKSNIKLENY
jgi:hypothetical protein